jgi:ABC-2 type transport system ATP-binding protein
VFYRNIGYCSQFEAFPRGLSGFQILHSMLTLHGMDKSQAAERAWNVIERVGMTEAARRRVAGYSKGMRQRIRLALALAHDPKVLVLDEPLNGSTLWRGPKRSICFESLPSQVRTW